MSTEKATYECFTAALFIIAKTWKNQDILQQVNKCGSSIMEYYNLGDKKEMLSTMKPTWNYLKCIFLSESNWFKS